jgi:hypothetical protein
MHQVYYFAPWLSGSFGIGTSSRIRWKIALPGNKLRDAQFACVEVFPNEGCELR